MWRMIGPALLFSGAAIGTSHLVQSTRAGALYGLALVIVILITFALKYPAFRFGVDYGHAARRSLMSGYRELGMWAPALFAIAAIPVVPVIYAALATGTAGIASFMFGISAPVALTAIGIFAAVALTLMIGGYDWLDRINRVLMAFLVISTIATTVMILPRVEWGTALNIDWAADPKTILFVVALAGFMPNPLDVSLTQSMWTAEAESRLKPGEGSPLSEARSAFFVGYGVTALLAVCFCIMGAGVMHSAGIAPEASAVGFAQQIVELYSSVLGDWAAMLVAIAALSVMLTTLFVALDIGGRHVASFVQETIGSAGHNAFDKTYRIAVPALVVCTALVLFAFTAQFTVMLDLAISVSFVGAPIIATLNHLVVTRCEMDDNARPSPAVRALNIFAIAVMTGLAAAFFIL
uniref:NRAMP family divalent metal transporter n=1 Tax=uncultured Erythrobacter sp. TaxID=263913 RepID=UPI002607D5AC|nr:divalent metal cation transporter [uncultured Erythrobacter sp.]